MNGVTKRNSNNETTPKLIGYADYVIAALKHSIYFMEPRKIGFYRQVIRGYKFLNGGFY